MKTLEQIKEDSEILKKLETEVTPENFSFVGEIEIQGSLSVGTEDDKVVKSVREFIVGWMNDNRSNMINGIKLELRKEIKNSKKEYQDHLDSEKNILKGILS